MVVYFRLYMCGLPVWVLIPSESRSRPSTAPIQPQSYRMEIGDTTSLDWAFSNIASFMPFPLKCLQSGSIAVSYIFGQLKNSRPGSQFGKKKESNEYTWKIAKYISEDVLGYSRNYIINDTDAIEESRIIQQDMSSNTIDVNS